MSEEKGLLQTVVDKVLHPEASASGSASKPEEGATAKAPKGAKKSKAAAKPAVEEAQPEGLQAPTGPIPGDYVDRSPAKKEAKLPKDYAAGQVDRIGEVVLNDESDEQK